MPFAARRTIIALLLTAIASAVADSRAAEVWHEGFESPQTSWRDAGGDAQYKILEHRRVQGDARSGSGCEWLRIEAGGGSRIYVAHDVGRPPVIEELAPSVWIKSDRPGVQLLLRIVLPRSLDQRTGQPATAIIAAGNYTATGRWQQLRLEGIPHLLTRQVHVLRMQLGPQVDEREAYLDAVLLNVYGGQGISNVWIDDLQVAGHATMDGKRSAAPPVDAKDEAWASRGVVRLPPSGNQPSARPRRSVKLIGGVLSIDERPIFPRVVQHCGEPLAALKELGFNAVWLKGLPAPELLEEAERLGLWLICSPPRPAAGASLAEIGPALDRVLAWDLGGGLDEAELDATHAWARQVRAADRRGNRPLICRPAAELRGYSRAADLLLLDRRPLWSSLEMSDYAAWLRRQPLLASLGTAVWTTVQTQPGEALRGQLAALEPGGRPPLSLSPDQIRLLVYTAVAAGSRGLLFLSDSPLDATDPDARRRAMTLELINLELELIEPWAAAGRFAASAEANLPQVAGSVLRVDRAQLLLPLWSAAGAQCAPDKSAAEALSLIAPGVPEADNAYLLDPGGLHPLPRKRIAGGVCVALGEFDLTAQVLLAHDPLIVSAVHRRIAQSGRRAAELQRDLAALEWKTARWTAGRIDARSPVAQAPALLDSARVSLQRCDAKLSAGDLSGGALEVRRAMRALRQTGRSYWEAARQGLASPATSPAALGFETLPAHWQLIDRLAAGRFGANLLAGGDFEDIGTMMQAGWRNMFHADPDVRSAVDLAPHSARSGRLGLRVTATAADPKNPPAVLERPPVFLTSPAVDVAAGSIVCVHGWARVPGKIEAATDGLTIYDSLGGEALADRIGPTDGWRKFALYRVAPQSGPMYVTIALGGLGEAWLDDVAVQVLDPTPATARR